jgi:MFS transporter, PHS family, inorganic phosphate transporter
MSDPSGEQRALPATASDVSTDLRDICIANILYAGVGLIPGYWATFAFIERLGRKKIQVMGFAMLSLLFLVMGLCFHSGGNWFL